MTLKMIWHKSYLTTHKFCYQEEKENNKKNNELPREKVARIYEQPKFRMKFFLLINVKMPLIVGILTFMSGENNILGLSEPKQTNFLISLYL